MEYLRWDDAKRWPASDCAAYDRFALREGDVVLAMDRPWVKAGLKRAQISGEDLPCLQVQRTARLRPQQTLREDFLFYLTGSQSFSRHLLEAQTGIGVPHISGKQIESFVFMRPPLNEQASIAGRLSALYESTQQLAAISQRKLTALDDLKKSLLHQAFSGQL
jgi:type I restriction enzyme S subunit